MTANAKKVEWEKENMRTVSCRLRKEVADKFREYAEYKGTSVHGLLSEYVVNCVSANSSIPEADKANIKALRGQIAVLERKLAIANSAADNAKRRAEHAEALVDKWLRSADGK